MTNQDMLKLVYGHGGGDPARIIFHEDPGHGWLQVPIELIHKLKIEAKISAYSYEDSKNVYLEEDCDLSLFFDALGLKWSENEEDQQKIKNFWELIPRKHTNNSSPIRRKQKYQVRQLTAHQQVLNQLSIF